MLYDYLYLIRMIEGIQYIIYDLAIVDVEERKQKAEVFPSGRKLAEAIGINQNKIPLYTNPKNQKKFYSVKLEKWYAIRVKT